MLEVELYDLRPFLPLPYEAALAPRLSRAQGWVEAASAHWLEKAPEALQAWGVRTRRDSRFLAAVGDGGPGAEAAVRCLGLPGDLRLLFPAPTSAALEEALRQTEGQPFSLAVSGPLEDPGVQALLSRLEAVLAERCGSAAAARRITAAAAEGTPLMDRARAKGWEILPVPAEAGRWDVLTAAGLLPAAAAGADIAALLRGGAGMLARCGAASYENPAWRYAAVRYELYRRGWTVEVLSSRDTALQGIQAWWRELFAGCEGKDGKALFPAVSDASAGPRGLGQYLQEGRRLMFETALRLGPAPGLQAWREDGLDLLQDEIQEALLRSHSRGGVPCLRIHAQFSAGQASDVPAARAEALGELLAFFQFACGLSARLLDVDPQSRGGLDACGKSLSDLLLSLTGPARQPSAAGRL